ncbi:uncharacterized protein LOC105284633 [Ooceraea biroi]|uniref:uncharacterized protein LOC105284633 n=1 Tax=Ooceraea biroi TaxID=2015173 RepID=UPI000F0898D0|nr:uncharacterized protein LOC105284633 [Ooceraea biroi]
MVRLRISRSQPALTATSATATATTTATATVTATATMTMTTITMATATMTMVTTTVTSTQTSPQKNAATAMTPRRKQNMSTMPYDAMNKRNTRDAVRRALQKERERVALRNKETRRYAVSPPPPPPQRQHCHGCSHGHAPPTCAHEAAPCAHRYTCTASPPPKHKCQKYK